MSKDLTALHKKIDQLSAQILLLTEQAEKQERRNQDFDELKADLIPIGNQLVNLTIQELEEIGYRIAIYPVSALYTATKAVSRMLEKLKNDGTTQNCLEDMVEFPKFNELSGLKELRDLEKTFL